jgi:hypothetical protein
MTNVRKNLKEPNAIFDGTFAVPRYFIPKTSSSYLQAHQLFKQIEWPNPPKRSDAIENRFNAFCSLLWAVTYDSNWTVHTDLNKASYDIKKWPINYDAMIQANVMIKIVFLIPIMIRKYSFSAP